MHVGGLIDWPTAELATEVTLRTLITHVDNAVASRVCQTDVGFGGPGPSALSVCGNPLSTGGQADAHLFGAPPSTQAFLFAGLNFNPTPLLGGQLVPTPPSLVLTLTTDSEGQVLLPGITGGGGPATVYAQYLYLDGNLPFGVGFSNAVAIDFLP